jgi:ribonuclease BN (tRNA processing enzyme)
VQGYPFFAPIYQADREIHLIPTMPDTSLFDSLFRQMDGAHFPVNADTLPSACHYVTSNGMEFLGEHGFDVSRIPTNHPGGCYGYRVENEGRSVVYISDNELDPPGQRSTSISEFVSFCRGADIMIHDSQYLERDMPYKRGWGHSLVSQVREVAAAARVKQLVLFHHDPDRSDDELDVIQDETRSWLRKNGQTEVMAAYEGLEFAV